MYCTDSLIVNSPYSVNLTNDNFVEVYYINQWLPICSSDSWNRIEGIVICRQSGYITYLNTYSSSQIATVGVTGVHCLTGNENSIKYCNLSNIQTVSSCHKVVVECSSKS